MAEKLKHPCNSQVNLKSLVLILRGTHPDSFGTRCGGHIVGSSNVARLILCKLVTVSSKYENLESRKVAA